jgi:uncharacterized protein
MNTWRLKLPCAVFALLFLCAYVESFGQGFTRQTYHDLEKKHLKEVYQVKDTISNILQGRYISYFLNGTIESKGQFTNNETTGVWEFFFETGNLRMRGILRQNANYGLWEFFYESGQKNMDGTINGKNREGEWKMYYENGQVKEIGEYFENKRVGLWSSYFEDGVMRGEIDYKDDFGTYTEYSHSGKVLAEGPKRGVKNVGHWRFFAEDGSLQAEGDYQNGKKHGEWVTYFSRGQVASKGKYENDYLVGPWIHYFEDGKVSSSGEYGSHGVKIGNWKTFNENGTVKSEVEYNQGTGDYREYFANGNLKTKGRIINSKKVGKWEFYYENGKLEGECEYKANKGTYLGYFEDGNLRTKGALEGDQKTGTWELYENDGKLSGYYRPFYDDRKSGKDFPDLSRGKAARSGSSARKLTYFDERFNEFKGLIVGGNPIMVFAGRLPLSVEYYLQERLGHEFEFVGIRNPFFMKDEKVPVGTQFQRGYTITVRQKMYNQTKSGMWYFGQEVRFTNRGHYVNQLNPISERLYTAGAIEQRIEYGILFGYRVMQRNYGVGATIDAFVSANAGYKGLNVDSHYEEFFEDLNRSRLATSIHFGLNIGHVFSFRP